MLTEFLGEVLQYSTLHQIFLSVRLQYLEEFIFVEQSADAIIIAGTSIHHSRAYFLSARLPTLALYSF